MPGRGSRQQRSCLGCVCVFSQWTEEDEITDYKKNRDWMDECVDGMFEKWYDKIDEEGSMEDRRKVAYSGLANSTFNTALPVQHTGN